MIIIEIMEFIFLLWESVEDIKSRKLSIYPLGVFCMAGIFLRLFYEKGGMTDMLCGMSMGIIMLVLAKVTGEAIGYGDGMVILICGIYSGWKETLLILYFAFVLVMIFSFGAIIRKGFCRDMSIPFVPCVFWGYLGGLVL